MKNLFRVTAVLFVLAFAISAVGAVSASDSALELVGAINEASNVGAGQPTNYVFRDITKTFNYSGGSVCLSSRNDQCSPPAIDDAVRIYVDGSEVFYQESYTHDFGPVDFSSKLHVGLNQVRIQLIDLMGPSRGGSALWLVPTSGNGGGGTPIPPAHTNVPFDQVQPGDLILMRNDDRVGKAQTLIYGGYWSHSLIVTDIRNGVPYVAESFAEDPYPWVTTPGVVVRPIYESGAWTALDAAIVRVKANNQIRNQAGNYALGQEHDPYNWAFWDKWKEDAFYCSQLDWAAFYHPNGIDLDSNQSLTGMVLRGLFVPGFDGPTLASLLSSTVVTPDDLYFSPNVELVGLATQDSGRQFKRMVIWAFSPVNFYLVDPNGRAIGTDPASGDQINEIPGAVYSGPDSEPEFIVIQDLTGGWTLHVSGTDTGSYTLIAEDASIQHQIVDSNGTTATGVDAVYDLNIDSGVGPILVPQDQTPPTTSVSLDGNKGLNDWFITPVTVTLSAVDNVGGVGVRNSEYSLDNGDTWTIYTEPFVLHDGVHQLLYRSIDHVNNLEIARQVEIKVDTVPPVVNVWTDQTEYTRVQPFTAHFSGYDPEPGSGLASLLALFNNQVVTDGQVVDLFWFPLGSYTLTVTGEDYAGWVTTNSKTITLIATIPSLQQAVSRLCSENYITKQGICTSLSQKLASALSAQQRGQNKTAVNILLAFQNELKAQKGKAVTVQAYDLLMMDSNYVIQVFGGK